MRNFDQDLRYRTIAACGANDYANWGRTMSPPIYNTVSYRFDSFEHGRSVFAMEQIDYAYSRISNPTVNALNTRLAMLNRAPMAVAFSSGHAAIFGVVISLCRAGDHFISSNKIYGGTLHMFYDSLKNFGITVDLYDSEEEIPDLVQKNTKMIFFESLSNPSGVLPNFELLKEYSDQFELPLVVDATMTPPDMFYGIDHGANVIIYSTTKLIAGHGNSLGGAVVDCGNFDWSKPGKYPLLSEPDPGNRGMIMTEAFSEMPLALKLIAYVIRDYGPTISPQTAQLTLMGMETLPLRLPFVNKSAHKVAEFLANHPKVKEVSYPGLKNDPNHESAKKYLKADHYGSMFSFRLKGGYEAIQKLVDNLELVLHATTIGDSKSLVICPFHTTHSQVPERVRNGAGLYDDQLRFSSGLEDPDDIIEDFDKAFSKI